MGLYDKNGDFNDNHLVLKAATLGRFALQTSTKDSTTFDFNYSWSVIVGHYL